MKTITLSSLLFFTFSLGVLTNIKAQTYVYQEEFYSQSNWTKGNNDDRELYVSDGKYYFHHKQNTGFREFTTRTFNLDFNRDFEILTSIKKISGEQDRGISFLFDYQDKDNYTEFGYTATGYYRVAESTTQKKYTNIKSWTSSSYINKGNYSSNNLRIKKSGGRLSFYINGSYVYGMDFSRFKGKKMAMRLYRNQKVAIDYFRVKYIGSSGGSAGGAAGGSTASKTSKTILFEGFNNNNNNWHQQDDSSARLSVENGEYVFNHRRQTGGWSSTIVKYINSSRNFRISAQIKKVSGIQNNGFGITFGKKNNDNQNHFLISADGSYKIVKFENGKRTYLKDWTKSSYIKKGNYATNYLKVQKAGSAYKFYINSNLVYTGYSVKLYGSRVGFTVYDNQTIKVGYLSLVYEDGKSDSNSNTNNNIFNSVSSKNKHVSKETILFDGYNDNRNNWSTTKNENVSLDVLNGNYFFDHKRAKGGWSSTIPKYIDTSRDFKIVADIKKESGILNNGYGIIFGRKDSNNQNLFFVNGNGSYSINKIKNGKDNFLKSWTPNSVVRKGNGGYNVLKVVKLGKKLEYYINDTKVYTDYSPEFFGERVGYILYDRQKISVAYISVGYLDKKKGSVNTSSSTLNSVNNSGTTVDKTNSYNYDNSGYHFSDQFNNNRNGWYIVDDDKIRFKIKNGKYYLKHKRSFKGWATYDYNYIDTNKDFEIQTKIDKISGTTDYGYGLIFGKHELNDFRFYISSGGSFKVSKKINNKEEAIKDWTKSSYINTGNQKSNILTVKKIKGYYKFYINGTFVYQMDFQSFFGNDLGFVVYNNQEVAVDYIRVKYAGSFVND
ncbi:hypothetical protein ACOSP6_03450 [Tenacibaculum sp. MEBiC06402]|uniref:hypothetical protein n=1 Tax=unclassified Tenacibaculum TaxID=2635139 RepID=UPI003B9B5E1A